jgi:predicted acetyltransferase
LGFPAVTANLRNQKHLQQNPRMELLPPCLELLPAYIQALARGWSPNNERGREAAEEELAEIERSPADFIAALDDRVGGSPLLLPDGSHVPRLPGFRRWIWDGEFCGSIGLRWQDGSDALPAYVLGHIGYAVVPWKRGRGYASEALRQTLIHARSVGLGRVDITTDPDNLASQRVIECNGGRFVETFVNEHFGPAPHLRYAIDLTSAETRDITP